MPLRPSGLCPPLLVATALLATRPALADDPPRTDETPTRPEQHESSAVPPSRVRLPIILGGLGLTAAFWGVGVGSAYLFPNQYGFPQMRFPVVGPWLALGNNQCPSGCNTAYYWGSAVYFVFSGIVQAGGLAVALEGVFLPSSYRPSAPAPIMGPRPSPDIPPEDRPSEPPPPAGKPLFFLPMPITIGRGGLGVGVGGIF